jgi:hypothetical protein
MFHKASFARMAALDGRRTAGPHCAPGHQPQTQQPASDKSRSGAFLQLGLFLAIALGLIGLRAAIWLPPMDL